MLRVFRLTCQRRKEHRKCQKRAEQRISTVDERADAMMRAPRRDLRHTDTEQLIDARKMSVLQGQIKFRNCDNQRRKRCGQKDCPGKGQGRVSQIRCALFMPINCERKYDCEYKEEANREVR